MSCVKPTRSCKRPAPILLKASRAAERNDKHRSACEGAPIGKILPIGPKMYYIHVARQADPAKAPPRLQRDEHVSTDTHRVREENFQAYGARKR